MRRLKYFAYIFRGKKTGHDVDILITHPEEGKETGILTRLLWQLQSEGSVLCGKLEKSTFKPEVLHTDFKLSMRGQLDHFEKWIGMFKVPKSVSSNLNSDMEVSVIYEQKARGKTGKVSGENPEAKSDSDLEEKDPETQKCKTQKGKNKTSEKSVDEIGDEETVKENGNDSTIKHLGNGAMNLNESIDDYETSAKKQRKCEDSELSPLELSQQPRDWLARRVDLIVSPYSQYYYALVGWTGNKQFNRDLRTYSKKELGMHMTSHGLYDMNKVNHLNISRCKLSSCS